MMVSSETALIDTNVLVHAYDRTAKRHMECRKLLDDGVSGANRCCIAPQILFEFVAVVTSPSQVSRPIPLEQALLEAEKLALALLTISVPLHVQRRRFPQDPRY